MANLKTNVQKKHFNLGMKRFSSESLKKYSHDLLPSGERWLSEYYQNFNLENIFLWQLKLDALFNFQS